MKYPKTSRDLKERWGKSQSCDFPSSGYSRKGLTGERNMLIMTNVFVDRHIIVYLYCIWLWLYVNVGILIMFYKCIHISPQNLLQIIEFGAFSPHLMFIQTKRHHWKDFLLGYMMSIFISLSINFKPIRIICRLQVQFHTVLSPMCWVSSDQDYLRQSLYFRGEETKTQGGPWSPLCQ